MPKQYAQIRKDLKTPEVKAAAKTTTLTLGVKSTPDRRSADRGHSGQLLWSFAVAVCLILAALLQWSAPKNALLEQDRSPAQIRFETVNTSLNGS
jgi:predicted metal-binding membrane protein